MKPKRLVIKIGTAVLVDAKKRLQHKIIQQVAQQLAGLHREGYELVLVSSGAVGAGRDVIDVESEEPLIRRRVLASIGQARLMQLWSQYFSKYGIIAAQVLPLRDDFHDREKYLTIRTTLERLLVNRVIPILNENDVLSSASLKFSDNDNLAVLTAIAIKADRLIFMSDTPGFYDKNPQTHKDAKLIKHVPEITDAIKQACSKSVSGVGLGGMINKMLAIEVATRACIDADICYGKEKNVLKKVLNGPHPGTHFSALCTLDKSNYLGKKAWLSAGVVPTGTIVIDRGAYDALKKKKSLLIVGVKGIVGDFHADEVVSLKLPDDTAIGTGLAHYGAQRLQAYLSKTAHKGDFKKPVVHADNMVIW